MSISLVNSTNIERVINMKATVLSLYPELAGLYSNTRNCTKCKKKSRGSAILLHIQNDPELYKKNMAALKQLFPNISVDRIRRDR